MPKPTVKKRHFDTDSLFDLDDGPWAKDPASDLWVTLDGRIACPGFLTYQERERWYPPRWVKEERHPNGYIYARAAKPFRDCWHRVVARAWIPNPDNKPQVNHIDYNKHNNNLMNLEWSTYSENNLHSWKQDRKRPQHNHLGQFVWN